MRLELAFVIMEPEPICMIQLCGSRYRVRVVRDAREVFVEDEWRPVEKFVDFLFDAGKYDELAEVAKFGHRLLRGEAIK